MRDREEWDSLDQLQQRLEGEDLALLMRYEARSNYLSSLWGRTASASASPLGPVPVGCSAANAGSATAETAVASSKE